MSSLPRFDGETYDPALDADRLTTLLERVHATMRDGHWHTLAELANACGGSEAGVSARIRDLRKSKFGSHDIERRRAAGADGLWQYRMVSDRAIADVSDPQRPSLGWAFHPTERYALVSVPAGFTVARVVVPVEGLPTPMYEAWDVRAKLADRNARAAMLGIYPWQDQAKARAEAEHGKGAGA